VQQRQLAFAIDQQLPVKITYQSASGGTTTRVISDIEMINGLLYAWCHLRNDDRVFSLDRIQAVAPVSV
jgi:predicted DNA-binding transcriptional regulator YafY